MPNIPLSQPVLLLNRCVVFRHLAKVKVFESPVVWWTEDAPHTHNVNTPIDQNWILLAALLDWSGERRRSGVNWGLKANYLNSYMKQFSLSCVISTLNPTRLSENMVQLLQQCHLQFSQGSCLQQALRVNALLKPPKCRNPDQGFWLTGGPSGSHSHRIRSSSLPSPFFPQHSLSLWCSSDKQSPARRNRMREDPFVLSNAQDWSRLKRHFFFKFPAARTSFFRLTAKIHGNIKVCGDGEASLCLWCPPRNVRACGKSNVSRSFIWDERETKSNI